MGIPFLHNFPQSPFLTDILVFMPGKIKFLYFDLGGVFFHWKQFPQTMSARFGSSPEKWQAVFDKYDDLACTGKISTQNLWLKYQKELNLQVDSNLDFAEIWASSFQSIPLMHSFARELSLKFPLGIITDVHQGIFEQILIKKSIPNLPYSPIIQSCEVGFRKPQKEIYDISLAKSGYKLEEILFIDDNPINITAAQNLGWNTVTFAEWQSEKSIAEIKAKLV